LKKANIGFEHMFEEVPIIIKNSHLISVLMWELEDKSTVADKHELLNLSSSFQRLSPWDDCDTHAHVGRSAAAVAAAATSAAAGLKSPDGRAYLTHCRIGQINNYCQNVKEFTSQNLGKLFMAEALQGHNS
ncbi:hypothetical protein CRUP_010560, partial [Coryphaenoides rupestris]